MCRSANLFCLITWAGDELRSSRQDNGKPRQFRMLRGGRSSFEVKRRRKVAKDLLSSCDELEMRGTCVRMCCCVFGRIRNECSVRVWYCINKKKAATSWYTRAPSEGKTWLHQAAVLKGPTGWKSLKKWRLLVCSCVRSPTLELDTRMH
jgi:hypothetical protein